MVDQDAARRYFRQREANRRAAREAERERWLAKTRQAIRDLLPDYPQIRQVYLYGSLVQPGRFRPDSDIDVAVDCENLAAESAFWRALEQTLRRDVDLRPLAGPIAESARREGEQLL